MPKILLTLSLIAMSTSALACSNDELQKKMTDSMTAMQAAMAKNAPGTAEWSYKLTQMQRKALQAKSIDEACTAYDALSAEIAIGPH